MTDPGHRSHRCPCSRPTSGRFYAAGDAKQGSKVLAMCTLYYAGGVGQVVASQSKGYRPRVRVPEVAKPNVDLTL